MKPKSTLRPFLAFAGCSLMAISSASALTYYWDNNGTGTTGFGSADLTTWSSGGSILWSQSNTGGADATLGTNVVTATTDAINFGANTTGNGLGAGTITVSGTVNSGNITIGSQSGAIKLDGGTINFANTVTFAAGGSTHEISSTITGASTSFSKTGVNSTLRLSNTNNSFTGAVTVVGNLELASLANGGSNSSLGASTSDAANIKLGSGNGQGSLVYLGSSNASTNRLVTPNDVAGSGIANNGSGALTFTNTGALAYGSSAAGQTRILTLGGSYTGGNNTFNPLLANNGTNATSFTKSGAGTWELANSSNSYTGQTNVAGGTLVIGTIADYGTNSAIGQGTAGAGIIIANGNTSGTLIYTGGVQSTNRMVQISTTANAASGIATILNNGTGTLTFTSTTFNPIITNGNNLTRTLALGGTNDGVIQGTIQNSSATVKNGVTKIGGGTWTLQGTSSYTATTAVQEGDLVAGTNSLSATNGAFGNATSDINLGVAGGSVDAGLLIGGAFNVGRNVRLLTSNDTDFGTRVLTIGGNTTDNSEFSGNIYLGTSGQASKGIQVTAAAGGLVTFSGAIQETGGTRTAGETSAASALTSVTKVGAGTVVLSGTNTYLGNTSVNQGVLNTTKAAALPGYDASGKVTFNGGTLGVQVGGSGWTTTEVNTLLTNAIKTSGAFGIDSTNGDVTQWAGFTTTNLGSTLGLTKLGANKLTLDQINNYAGATTVNAGTLQIGNGGTTGSLTGTSSITVGSGANLTINRSDAFAQATDLNGKAITGTGSFTQAGSGTTTLAVANSYSGATIITGGTLQVSGSGDINQSSGVAIGSGATFRYNSSVAYSGGPITNNGGTIAGTGPIGVTIGLDSTSDILAPGNSPGIQEFTVGQSWASFTYQWEVNDFNGTTAGTDFDRIQITGGGLTLTGATAGSYVLDLVSLAGLLNTAGNVADFSETTTSWNILTASGGISGFNKDYWTIDTSGFITSNDPDFGGTWSLSATSNNLVLTYTAVPEPRAALLGGLGLLALLRRRRLQ